MNFIFIKTPLLFIHISEYVFMFVSLQTHQEFSTWSEIKFLSSKRTHSTTRAVRSDGRISKFGRYSEFLLDIKRLQVFRRHWLMNTPRWMVQRDCFHGWLIPYWKFASTNFFKNSEEVDPSGQGVKWMEINLVWERLGALINLEMLILEIFLKLRKLR